MSVRGFPEKHVKRQNYLLTFLYPTGMLTIYQHVDVLKRIDIFEQHGEEYGNPEIL